MYQQERMDEIIKILEKNNYVTVDYLVNEIKYSPASIRRDLTLLEKQGLVKRSYGGVTYNNANFSPYKFRQHSMKIAKNAIAKKAATVINNGDVVFIDGSSTCQYLGRYITDKKGITVLTSNMILADFLSQHGINTYCTGGKVVEYPGILGGDFMLESLKNFNIDITFFSSSSFNLNGNICSSWEAVVSRCKAYRKYSKKLAFLCGSDKFNEEGKYNILSLDDIEYFISDKSLPEDLMKGRNTKFLFTN